MTRQEAVKWLSNLKMDIGKTQHQELWHYEQALDEIMQALEQDRPTAHWKDGKWCSNCGEGIPTDVYGRGITEEEAHFCISCGARMESDGE